MKQPFRKKPIITAAVLALLLSLSACGENAPAPTTADAGKTAGSEVIITEKPMTEESETASNTAADAVTEYTESEDNTATKIEIITESTERAPVNMEMVLATLNIKHGAEGLDTIAEAILEVSPDIIGLEEVDVNCDRSGNIDEPAELARLAGYPYYAFSKAINLGDGEYGTAILSRYPIESFEVIPLESGNGEHRSVGHAVISVEGLELHALVTHLSYESRSLRIDQMETIADMISEYPYYVVMGDFNSFDLADVIYLGGAYYVNRPDRSYTTFRRFDSALDNIVVSSSFTELSSAISDRDCSDHKLLYAVFQFTEKEQ